MPNTDNLEYQALRYIDANDRQITREQFIEFFKPVGKTLYEELFWEHRLINHCHSTWGIYLTESGKKALDLFIEHEFDEHDKLIARINAIYDCIAYHNCLMNQEVVDGDDNLIKAERLIGEWLAELQGPEPDTNDEF